MITLLKEAVFAAGTWQAPGPVLTGALILLGAIVLAAGGYFVLTNKKA